VQTKEPAKVFGQSTERMSNIKVLRIDLLIGSTANG
jgi:hypothetical protein